MGRVHKQNDPSFESNDWFQEIPDCHEVRRQIHTPNSYTVQVAPTAVFGFQPSLETNDKACHSIELSVNAGNTWVQSVQIHKNSGGFQSGNRYLNADGVLQKYSLRVTYAVDDDWEVGVGVHVANMNQGVPPIDDGTIEAFHSRVMGIEDPFERRRYGMGQTNLTLKDYEGDYFSVEKNKGYALPMDLSLRHYKKLYQGPLFLVSHNYDAHVSIPLDESINPYAGLGGSMAVVSTFNPKGRISVTTALGGDVTAQKWMQVGSDSYDHYDDYKSVIGEYQALLGLNIFVNPNNKLHLKAMTTGRSSGLETKDHKITPHPANRAYGRKAATGPHETLNLGLAWSTNRFTTSLTAQEDVILLKKQDPLYLFFDGENLIDFGVTFGVEYRL